MDFLDVLANLPRLAPRDATLLVLLTYTGIRRGEALELQWGDLDFDAGLISAERNGTSAHHRNAQKRGGAAFYPDGEGTVPLPASITKSSFCCGDGNAPMTESTFGRVWQSIGKTIDLHGATPR